MPITPPPGEGFRSRPCRAAGPQRQGPHCRLRARLERPEPPAAPTPRADHQGLPGRAAGAAVGLPQQPVAVSASRATRAIAERAECARSTVAEALKALEWAGVLTWQNRITRILVRERDLFGQWASRWQVIRTSNAYVFSDPKPQPAAAFACKSENPPGTPNQES